MKLFCLLLSVHGLVHCGDVSPTTPSSSPELSSQPATLDLGGRAQTAPFTLKGRLTDAVNGEPIGGARVEVPGVTTAQTRADGSFELHLSEAEGELPLVLEAEAYWRRDSHLLAESGNELQANVLPDGEPFDLHFFDHVFRQVGESGTRRWTIEPEFELWTRVFDCLEVERGSCETMVATDQMAPGSFLNWVRDVVSTDSSKLTGGFAQGSTITEISHPPGTVLGGAEELMPAWTVTIAVVQLPSDSGSWARYWYYESGRMYAGHIQISKRYHKLERGVISHELAHILGYDHPRGGDYVPLPSIMRYGHGPEPSRHDILHGRILYERAPGSRTPDVDPEAYFVNAHRALEAPGDALVETLVHN